MRTTEDSSGATQPKVLLASDLDGTLIPPSPNTAAEQAIETLTKWVRCRRSLVLAYATGRHLDLAMEGIHRHGLPIPSALICDVGTRIYQRRDRTPRFEEDPDYAAAIESGCGSNMNVRIRNLLKDLPPVRPQEEVKQGRFKVSFYVDPDVREADVLDRVRERLGRTPEAYRIVYSIDSTDGRGLLDVLPAVASKGRATAHLQKQLGLSPDDVLYAGDSGNDTDALLAGFKGILVGNAPESLRQFIRQKVARMGIEGRVYLATSHYGDGVIEGCRHFGLF